MDWWVGQRDGRRRPAGCSGAPASRPGKTTLRLESTSAGVVVSLDGGPLLGPLDKGPARAGISIEGHYERLRVFELP